MKKEVSGGRGHGRGSLRVMQGGSGCEGEEPKLSSEPSSEVRASGQAVPSEAPPSQVFGLGSVAHMVLGGSLGSYLSVNLSFGFGVTMGVHVAGKISGE